MSDNSLQSSCGLRAALVRPLRDSKPPLIHRHFEGETLLQHLAWRQTNFTYYIQQKKSASVTQLISWCQCLIRQRGLFGEAWQLISAVRPV